jgi:hypothetical protein
MLTQILVKCQSKGCWLMALIWLCAAFLVIACYSFDVLCPSGFMCWKLSTCGDVGRWYESL